MNKSEFIDKLDYTLLTPTASNSDIAKFCNETIEYGFKTVFVNPYYIKQAYNSLADYQVKVGAPIGFSLGGMRTEIKVAETKLAIADGASEIDMLINLGALKSKDYQIVKHDISEVVKASEGLLTKVIIETGLLTEEEKRVATELVKEAGADFVKTSTGFNGGGATAEDVKLLRSIVGPEMGVKAAGGVRSKKDVEAMIEAGANRIGTSSAVLIINGGYSDKKY
ncbi:2-deoxyribose-5-phosphate aldolase [Halolactibacillus alkaliphilus]|uniref:Deoxyribose-phosphate aldolase n=1 Tax=Halolactibacillus alkaliphilus TaxID=442899 RepID=A0A511X3B0_9BACI|nr:deoxyribose-phosphate aldolase [Halolactibacillus alkaliphilus]GEN57436.1 2-deoxyribose-5-phosphate aldolase [Halolactibacillus alkaliphilus]GGN68447.1 2-deoxyribose-5-phosphate aldolase [Halolactibacillus alkaliphilus]SFO94965.1 deoxyribose-phosphate aldolase [Halolactibacillus alkaliphilus]